MNKKNRSLYRAAAMVVVIAYENRANACDLGDCIESTYKAIEKVVQSGDPASPPAKNNISGPRLVPFAFDIVAEFEIGGQSESTGDATARILNTLLSLVNSLTGEELDLDSVPA